MGALDLALHLQNQEGKCPEELLPHLKEVTGPTGREQVILNELLGHESKAQDILHTPGYGLYDVNREWILPEIRIEKDQAAELFICGEAACIRVCRKLDKLIQEHATLAYETAWNTEELLGNGLKKSRYTNEDPDAKPLDAYPFREMWEKFYEQ